MVSNQLKTWLLLDKWKALKDRANIDAGIIPKDLLSDIEKRLGKKACSRTLFAGLQPLKIMKGAGFGIIPGMTKHIHPSFLQW